MSARSFRRERMRALDKDERRGAQRAKRVVIAAGGLFAAAAVVAPAANAATFTVDSLGDDGDGNCQGVPGAGDATCTLRDAINAASENGNFSPDPPDVITFASNVRGTIQLAVNKGSLQIYEGGVDIQGPGADQLTVVAPQVDGEGDDRVFKIYGFVTGEEKVDISGLTATGGDTNGNPWDLSGGAILSTSNVYYTCGAAANLTLDGVVVSDSVSPWEGGGVAVRYGYCYGGTEKQKSAPVSGSGSLNILNSTIHENASGSFGGGVSMDHFAGSLSVSNSTIVDNDAAYSGGGIAIAPPATKVSVDVASTLDVDNSTITGNDAAQGGGGIYTSGDMGLRSTIVHSNTSTQSDADVKATSPSDLATYQDAKFDAGYSLIGTRTGATVVDTPGEPNLSAAPELGALGNNGGPTPTRLPATTSPAIDTGISNSLTGDQRGFARTVDRDAANAADGTDIGAVEVPVVPPVPDEEDPPVLPGPVTELCLGKQVILTKGTDADESIAGTGVDDGILSGGGKDTIDGLSGDDCLFGQVGNDLVVGGPGNDNVNGNRDNDVVRGDDGEDSVRGQNGNDKVFGGPGDDPKVTGGAGNDKISGGPGDDFIKGDGGNDIIKLGSGRDFVHSGGGADTIDAVDGQKDTIICGTGKDIAKVDPIDKVDDDCNEVVVVD